jgi:DNA-binding response OmpR family regulator
VLIIDDEENFVASVTYGLAAYGFDGFGAGTAAAGLEAARRRRPHAVLLYQLEPLGEGVDLDAPLRALDDAPAIVVLEAHGVCE